MRDTEWVDALYNSAFKQVVSHDTLEYSNPHFLAQKSADFIEPNDFDPKKLKQFIAEYFQLSDGFSLVNPDEFEEETIDRVPRRRSSTPFTDRSKTPVERSQTLTPINAEAEEYYCAALGQQFTKKQMHTLIRFMVAYRYDGALHREELSIVSQSHFSAFFEALKQNLKPQTFAYQLLNLLPVTAVLTWAWEDDPSYHPSFFVFLGLGIMTLPIMRNIHFYSSITSGMASEEMNTIREAIAKAHDTLQRDLVAKLSLDPADAEKLERMLVKPSFSKRLDLELRSWAAFSIKMTEALAIFYSVAFKALPWYFKLAGGVVAGIVQGVDISFNNVNRIGCEQQSLAEWQRNTIASNDTADNAFYFPRIANAAFIPWAMAKCCPSMWVVIKTFAAIEMMELLELTSDTTPGGLYGFYLTAILSALFNSNSFSVYNVDDNLAKHLLTKRTFAYKGPNDTLFNRIGQALMGSVPPTAVVAFLAHEFGGLNYELSGAVSLPTMLAIASGIVYSEKFAHGYSQLCEMRFVNGVLRHLDQLHIIDKLTLFTAGAALSITGTVRNNVMMATAGEPLFFLMMSALLAERSRSLANAARYTFVQAFLYASAMLTWVLNCVLPFLNLYAWNLPADQHPAHLTESYFGKSLSYVMAVGALTLGLAGYFDYKATGMKVAELNDEIPANEKRSSLVGRVCSRVVNGCSIFGKYVTGRDADEGHLLAKPIATGL